MSRHARSVLLAAAFVAGVILVVGVGAGLRAAPIAALITVFRDDTYQLTGVAISKTNRLFVNYPRWSDTYLNAVVEVRPDGSVAPYPDERWNRWDGKPESAGEQFVCVQSVYIDDTDVLWVLDPAAPMMGTVVSGGAKLVRIDLDANHVQRVLRFGADVATAKSYLNDVRVDTKRQFAYITDSGIGGIIVVNLSNGHAYRTLDDHPSVKADPEVKLEIDGRPVVDASGKPPTINSDGIALSPDGEYLYYQALTGRTLYRVKTEALRENNGHDAARAVEKVATTFPVDGMWMDAKSRLYLSGLTQDGVLRLTPPSGRSVPIVIDPRLIWPDSFAEGPDGYIYITASHINESPRFNKGKSTRKTPYEVFKFKPDPI